MAALTAPEAGQGAVPTVQMHRRLRGQATAPGNSFSDGPRAPALINLARGMASVSLVMARERTPSFFFF